MASPTDNAFTYLTITSLGVNPYSARGLTQTLEPLASAAQLRRTVNAKLVDISMAQFRQFTSTISGTDQEPPVFCFPGREVTVGCIQYLVQPVGEARLRNHVPDSEIIRGGLVRYRPILIMKVVNLSLSGEEYAHETNWTLTLEEARPAVVTP